MEQKGQLVNVVVRSPTGDVPRLVRVERSPDAVEDRLPSCRDEKRQPSATLQQRVVASRPNAVIG